MKAKDRRIGESPLWQGEDEQIVYSLTTTPWGSDPSSVSVVVKDADGNDVTATVTTGSASVVGDIITLPAIHSLAAGAQYRIEIEFTVSGNVEETWCDLFGQE